MLHCQRPGKSGDLHNSVVSEVKASAQAAALQLLDPHLSIYEKGLIRKARDKAGKGPKGSHPAIYAKATGFETIVGWLFLKNPSRLAHLFELLQESQSDIS